MSSNVSLFKICQTPCGRLQVILFFFFKAYTFCLLWLCTCCSPPGVPFPIFPPVEEPQDPKNSILHEIFPDPFPYPPLPPQHDIGTLAPYVCVTDRTQLKTSSRWFLLHKMALLIFKSVTSWRGAPACCWSQTTRHGAHRQRSKIHTLPICVASVLRSAFGKK